MEGALRRHKEATIKAPAEAYLRLRGTRGWMTNRHPDDPARTQQPGGPGRRPRPHRQAGEPLPASMPEAWLPPYSHREVIVDWLRRAGAALLSEAEAERFRPGKQATTRWCSSRTAG